LGWGKSGESVEMMVQDYRNRGKARGINGSVNIPESCDFSPQFDPLNIIF